MDASRTARRAVGFALFAALVAVLLGTIFFQAHNLMAVAVTAVLLGLTIFFAVKADRGAADAMKHTCSSTTAAVEFVSWRGSVRSFLFSNLSIRDMVAAANSGKVLSSNAGSISNNNFVYTRSASTRKHNSGFKTLVIIVLLLVGISIVRLDQSKKHGKAADDGLNTTETDIAARSYLRYTNTRFGFSVLYPANFQRHAEPENGDGLSFTSPDSKSILTVTGRQMPGVTTSEQFNQRLESINGRVTYKRLTAKWFVISWEDPQSQTIGYEKTFVGEGFQNTLEFIYPMDQRKQFDPELTKIAKSFKPGEPTSPTESSSDGNKLATTPNQSRVSTLPSPTVEDNSPDVPYRIEAHIEKGIGDLPVDLIVVEKELITDSELFHLASALHRSIPDRALCFASMTTPERLLKSEEYTIKSGRGSHEVDEDGGLFVKEYYLGYVTNWMSTGWGLQYGNSRPSANKVIPF
jgi:hypothetical protein